MAAAAAAANRPPYVKTALAGTFAVGNFVSLWTAAGQPGAGAAPAGTPGAVPTSATAGAIGFTNPAAGNSYLARLFAASSVPGTLTLYDRLCAVGGIVTTTGAPAIASAALTRPDANGVNAEIWIEITTVCSATGNAMTLTYTNSAGVASHTTTAIQLNAAGPIGLSIQCPLQAGDVGVQTVTGCTNGTTQAAGAFNVVIRRRLASFPMPAAFVPYPPQDPFWAGLAQIYNSACIEGVFLISSGTAAPAIVSGELVIAQG
jgi:hypothetical protein